MHHVTYKRRKTPYNRPRFNVGWKPALVKRLKVVAGAGIAPEAELGGMIGRKLAVVTELKVVIGRKQAPETELGGVIGAKPAPEADLRR